MSQARVLGFAVLIQAMNGPGDPWQLDIHLYKKHVRGNPKAGCPAIITLLF
jgi:hypothetical protein